MLHQILAWRISCKNAFIILRFLHKNTSFLSHHTAALVNLLLRFKKSHWTDSLAHDRNNTIELQDKDNYCFSCPITTDFMMLQHIPFLYFFKQDLKFYIDNHILLWVFVLQLAYYNKNKLVQVKPLLSFPLHWVT